jgi:hypothetical protein
MVDFSVEAIFLWVSAALQVKSLLVQNNLPTDLQLHCYMRELVKAQQKQDFNLETRWVLK